MSPNLKRARPQRASKPLPTPAPLIAPTGKARVDIVADVVNRTADAWKATPPAEQGVCGVIAAGVGVGLQTFGAPFEALETGFAALTADLAALMPGSPAATVSPTTMGLTLLHAHAHPPTFGVPLPGLGPLVIGGCQSVAIGGKPAARAGDLGLAPTCGGFMPAYECFTGSSNTFIGGSRAARKGDIIRQCDPTLALGVIGKVIGGAGLIAGVAQVGAENAAGNAAAAAAAAAQAAADAAALAISALLGKDPGCPPGIGCVTNGNNTVLIGGLPVPDVLDMLGGLLKLVKLGKRAAKGKGGKGGSTPPKARTKDNGCNDPGHPIDPATGAVYDELEDFVDPDSGFSWSRWYRSSWSDEPRALGPGWRHNLDKRLRFYRTRCVLVDYNGNEIEFPCVDEDAERYEGTVGGYHLTQTAPGVFDVTFGDEAMRFSSSSPRLRWSEARLTQWIRGDLDLQLTYDRRGHLVRIHEHAAGQARGHEIDLSHDRAGRIIKVERGPANGPKTVISRYDYDGRGRLAGHVDALGNISSCAYDRDDRLTCLTNRNGYSFRWRYDSLGRCIETSGEDGLYTCRFEYEPGRTIVTKGDGGRWTYSYNRWGQIDAIVDPYGAPWRYEFNADGRIAAEIDPNDVRIEWIYDATGRLLGRRNQFGYPLPKLDEDPNYQPRRETEPTTTPMGWHTGEAVRRFGSVEHVRVPSSLHAEVEAVWRGHVSADQHEASPVSRDAAGRLAAQPSVLGSAERFDRDPEGNPTLRVDLDGCEHRSQYSSWNLRTAEQDPEGRVTRYEFDGELARTKITDPGGTVTEYPRDQRGRIDRVVRAGRLKERYEYDLADQLSAKYDKHDQIVCRYEVGEHGLQTKKTLASGDVIEYAYDRRGRIAETTTTPKQGPACHVQREHDLLGEVLSDTRDGLGVIHGAEAGARVTTVLDRFRTAYRRSDKGEWVVQTPDGSHHTFQHNAMGFIVAELANGSRELSCFDAAQRCAGKVAWRAEDGRERLTRTAQYRYSREGELHTVADSERGTTHYGYDRSHRLVHEVSDTDVDETWEYDAAGNLVTIPGLGWARYEPGNRLVEVGGEKATYDDRDNLIELRRGIEWTRFSYDSLDNLVRVQWSDREQVWTAAYDGLGRRIWKQYGDARTEYYWDDDRLAAEIGPDGGVRVYAYTTSDAFVPFAFVDYDGLDAEPFDGRIYYVFTNQIGAPIRIEDGAGEPVWLAERYQAYGALELAPGARIECNLRWPGHFFDPETGLHYNRYRYYSPRLGRYIQTDPLGIAGGINTHAAPSNPVATVDLLGLQPPCKRKKDACTGKPHGKAKPDAESDGVHPSMKEALGKPDPAWELGVIRNERNGVDFADTPYLYPVGPGQKSIVKIEYTGSRRQDFAAANSAGGFGTTQTAPLGYTWHHLDDYDPVTNTGTMQLVRRKAHEATYPHNGGVKQYKDATGKDYK